MIFHFFILHISEIKKVIVALFLFLMDNIHMVQKARHYNVYVEKSLTLYSFLQLTGHHDYEFLLYLYRINGETRKDHALLFAFPPQKAHFIHGYIVSLSKRSWRAFHCTTQGTLILFHCCIMLHCTYVL